MNKLIVAGSLVAALSGATLASTGGVTVPTWDDHAALEERVSDLEARVVALEERSGPDPGPSTPDGGSGEPMPTEEPSPHQRTPSPSAPLHGVDIDESNTGLSGAGYAFDARSNTWTHPERGPLQIVRDGISTTGDGQVIEHVEVHGMIHVLHRNVTIRNVRVIYDGTLYAVDGLRDVPEHANLRIEWSEIEHVGGPEAYRAAGVRAESASVEHVNIHGGFGTCIVLHGVGSASYNYCHGLTRVEGAHTNGLALERTGDVAGPFMLVGNRTEGGTTAAITMFAREGPFQGALIVDNFMSGGTTPSYCFHGPENKKAGDGTRDVHVVGNVFDTVPYPDCGQYGPYRNWDGDRPGARWCDNRFVDGQPVGHDTGCGT